MVHSPTRCLLSSILFFHSWSLNMWSYVSSEPLYQSSPGGPHASYRYRISPDGNQKSTTQQSPFLLVLCCEMHLSSSPHLSELPNASTESGPSGMLPVTPHAETPCAKCSCSAGWSFGSGSWRSVKIAVLQRVGQVAQWWRLILARSRGF